MIFLFPDLEALRIALTSGQVPPDVSREPVEVAFDAAGRPSVKPHAIPPKAMQNALKRLGIKTAQAHHGEAITLASWPQILPVVRVSGTPEFSATTPVLFELPIAQLGTLATEMLRLGNDRQSFRVVGDSEADQRVLLRVIGPPYYTLLRALDHLNADVAAYLEQPPRVWVEIGCAHPLAAKIKVAEGQMLLLRSPRVWKTIADEPFQDLYEVLDFQLPKAAVPFAEGKLKGKLTVPLRLAAGNAAEVPEMWVLKDNAFDVFDAFVRDADDRLMSRLMFAVAEKGEHGPAIVLRMRTSKLAPPAIELDGALGYVPFRRLGNLFLPVGTRLQPTLRRDAVRKMLAEDDAQIVWLASTGDGHFVPESLPDAAFRPLPDWVDYVIDEQRQPLQNWMQATRFDFDDFICQEENPLDAPKPPGSGKPKKSKPGERPEKIDADDRSEAHDAKDKKKPKAKDDASYTSPAPAKPNELKIQRTALEQAFLAIEGPLDAPDRLAYWPRLAQLNTALGDHAEAAICWLNAFWEMDEIPADGARAWLEGEEAAPRQDLKKAEIDRLLAVENPLKTDLRRLAATLLFAATSAPAVLKDRLPAIRAYLDKHDAGLPVRAVWLVWKNLARLSGDVLGLARVRDRLLDRLFTKGLQLHSDVPTFVRFAGRKETDRLRRVLEVLHEFHLRVRKWLLEQDHSQSIGSVKAEKKESREAAYALIHKNLSATNLYAELIFAYGFARVGEESNSIDLMTSTLKKLRAFKGPDKTAQVPIFFAEAFEFRIGQLNRGESAGPMPHEILKKLDSANIELMYCVNKLRKTLHILEPHEKGDPYLVYKSRPDAVNQQIATLTLAADTKKLPHEIRRIVHDPNKKSSREDRMWELAEIIPLTIRLGESFAKEMLDLVFPLLTPTRAKAPNPNEGERLGNLIDAVIPVAANYGWVEIVQQLLDRFVKSVEALDEPNLLQAINHGVGRWCRALRKCGLVEQVRSTLNSLTTRLHGGRELGEISKGLKGGGEKASIDMLRAQLHLAECWLSLGESAKVQAVMDEARLLLFDKSGKSSKSWNAFHYVQFACSYIRAIGQNHDLEYIVAQLSAILQNLAVIPNSTTASTQYSPLHLAIVESVMLTIVNEDLILGDEARRFLDDDEYLVRRRIHGDMRALLAQSGL